MTEKDEEFHPEAENIDVGQQPENFDTGIDYDPLDGGFGESESGGGRSSIFQEFPERMRAGSEDSGRHDGPDLRLNKSRRSSDVQSLQSRFEFDQSPRGSSMVSHRSRLPSVGEMDFNQSLLSLDPEEHEDESIFKNHSLQEEPETQTQGQVSNKVILITSNSEEMQSKISNCLFLCRGCPIMTCMWLDALPTNYPKLKKGA